MHKIKDIKNYISEKKKEDFLEGETKTIEEVVNEYVQLPQTSDGWHSVYCAVCGDGSRTQGPRGGWKFENENTYYNCFNCGVKGAFTPEEEYPMSKDMKLIFNAFNIPKKEYAKILFRIRDGNPNFKPLVKSEQKETVSELMGKGITQPDYLVPLDKVLNYALGKKCLDLLESKCIDYKDYPFFVSAGETNSKNPTEKTNAKILYNRLIIPIYYKDRLLLLQGRDLSKNGKKKYINIGNISNTVYGLDRLNEKHKYVFVTEGFFDAYHLNGAAVITNNISSTQVKILNAIQKEKVIAADKKGDYNTLVNRGLKQKWGISVPPEFRNLKDVTDAVNKYGCLYTSFCYMKAASFGEKALLVSKNF